MASPICFKTERLWLKPTNTEDASFYYHLMNTSGWLRYIGDRKIYSEATARRYIVEKILPQFQRLGYGAYTLVLSEEGTKIGVCGLYDRAGIDGVDIGFALLPEYGKKGYALEAANWMKQIAFELFGLKKLSAITLPENLPSRRLLEKLGMVSQGLIRLPPEEKMLLLYELHFEIEGPV